MQIELANSIGNQTKIPKHFSLKNSQKVYLGKIYLPRENTFEKCIYNCRG